MTETIFMIQLSELQTVRIRCRKGQCPGVIEAPIESLTKMAQQVTACPLCREEIVVASNPPGEPLINLGRAIREALKLKDEFTLEFPVPLDGRTIQEGTP